MSPIKLTLGRALRFQAWVRFVAVIVLLPCRWLTRRRLTAPRWRWAGGCRLCVSVDGAERLTARWWRAPAAAVRFALSPPRVRGCAPLPPDPYLRQAELAGFCALRARAALRAGVSVLAHGATRACCAGACSDPQCARCLRAPAAPLALLAVPGVRGCAPLPPDPYPRQAELAGFCALRARAALRAGVAVLAHGATRRVVLAHAATRPCALARATTRPCVLSLSFGRVSPRRSAIAPRLP